MKEKKVIKDKRLEVCFHCKEGKEKGVCTCKELINKIIFKEGQKETYESSKTLRNIYKENKNKGKDKNKNNDLSASKNKDKDRNKSVI